MIVALGQLAGFLVVAVVAAVLGLVPVQRAWAADASDLLVAHHDAIHRAAAAGGRDHAEDLATVLGRGSCTHTAVALDGIDWSADRLGVDGRSWETVRRSPDGPPGHDGHRVFWTTTTPPSADSPGLAVFSVAEWSLPSAIARRPAPIVMWAISRFGLAALVGALLAAWITRPILRLRTSVADFAAGDLASRPGGDLQARRDEIGDLAREVATMSDRIEGLVNAHRELLDDVAHELRSPLARINVAIELADPPSSSADTPPGDLNRVRTEARRLGEIVDRLLRISALEHEVDDPATRPTVDLHDVLDRVVADCAFEASATNRAVRVDSTGSVPIRGDADLLRSAIENVIRNAIRHTPVESDLEVELRTGPESARILVRDYGTGVPEHALEDIFRPFHRLPAPHTPTDTGSGLGLSIARRVIRAHGGTIRAANRDGNGLDVRIEIPLGRRGDG